MMRTPDIIRAPFANTTEAATGLRKVATGPFLATLPFNRFDRIDKETWWLAPVSQNPAYQHGKIACSLRFFEPELFVGFYIEKGIDPDVAGRGQSAKEQRARIDPTWLWHSFSASVASGDIDLLLGSLQRSCGRRLVVAVDGAVEGEEEEFVRFDWDGGGLASISSVLKSGRFGQLPSARSLASLLQLISEVPDIGWTWIDLQVGLAFSRTDGQPWSASEIWRRLCAPWRPWLR
jgi:hypothetical protein